MQRIVTGAFPGAQLLVPYFFLEPSIRCNRADPQQFSRDCLHNPKLFR